MNFGTSDTQSGSGSSTASTSYQQPNYQRVFEEFESFNFNDDAEFKAGLPTVIAAIRGRKVDTLKIDEMLSKAQWFFFVRKKQCLEIPWEAYACYSRSHHSSASSSTTALDQLNALAEAKSMMQGKVDGEQGLTFDVLCRLIKEGRTDEIPRTDVPDGLNAAPPSKPTLPKRPKPWEYPQASDSSSYALDSSTSFPAAYSDPVMPDNAWHAGPSGDDTSNRTNGNEAMDNDYGQMSQEDMALVFGAGNDNVGEESGQTW